jgi:hypothetical protein
MLTDFHGDEAKKKILEKKNHEGRLKNTEIFNSPNSHFFPQKFQGLVLGLVQ